MTGVAALSVITYTAWKFWVLKDRWDKTGNFPDQQILFLSEAFYTLLMLYLLLSINSAFLIIAFMSMSLHVMFGCYVELFRPEIELKHGDQNVLANYWRYILFDTSITFMSFLLISGVQNG